MTEESVLRWWKQCSEELMNEENKREEDKWRKVRGRVLGPDDIPLEVLTCLRVQWTF